MSTNPWPNEFVVAAEHLGRAANFADALERSEWDFAVEIQELTGVGLSRVDLRWLVCQGLLAHAEEVPPLSNSSGHRLFQPSAMLTFSARTCFVLTAVGRLAVGELALTQSAAPGGSQSPTPIPRPRKRERSGLTIKNRNDKPLWKPDLNRLFLGELLVKYFRRPAPNQQLILSAFQEENWPSRIDDPLPPSFDTVPNRRLQDTIGGLNRHQTNPILRFSGDGYGKGIRWVANV